MKPSILIQTNGSLHYWTLRVVTKIKTYNFYLGNDIRFCTKVLKIQPQHLVNMLQTNQIQEGTEANIKLAKLICLLMDIDNRSVRTIPSKTFCAN